jgi:hypothetical protein
VPRLRPVLFLLFAASVLAAPAASAEEPAPATASGSFEDRKWKLPIAGAYVFWDASSGIDSDTILCVAVSNAEFVADALDAHYDRRHAISTLFADDEVKVVYFEFSADGRYRGLSYYFESGDGCGYCYDSKVKSTVTARGGRLSGTVSYKDADRHFDVTFDVPVPSKAWGEPLPADGGAPGKAYLAYAAALEKEDRAAARDLLDAAQKARWDKHAEQKDLDAFFDYLWDGVHTRMQTIRITGGYERGDRAVVLFDGSSRILDRLHGEALLRRENGRWLVHGEMVDIGSR